MSNMSKLRNWHRTNTGTLHGNVYSDHRWDDATFIRTTQVQMQGRIGDALIAHTLNTTYELCREDGSEWFSTADIEVETPVEKEQS